MTLAGPGQCRPAPAQGRRPMYNGIMNGRAGQGRAGAGDRGLWVLPRRGGGGAEGADNRTKA